MLGIPAHTMHILQPLDVGICTILKRFNQLCINAEKFDDRSRIARHYFSQTWQSAQKAASPAVIASGFKHVGIFPFDPTAVDDSKIKKYKLALLLDFQSYYEPCYKKLV